MKQRCDHHPLKGFTQLTCSDAPDTSKSQEAALMTANLSKEQLDWAKQIYAETAPDRAAASARANRVSDAQLAVMDNQGRIANDANQYNKDVYQPLERGIVRDAEAFDTEGKRADLAGKALADVNQQFGAARAAEARQMARLGINPSDGAYAEEATLRGNAQALAGAGAATKARSDALTLAHAYKLDAASLGRGLPATQATAAGLAINAGNASAADAGMTLQPNMNAQAALSGAYNGARTGLGTAGNIYGGAADTQARIAASNNQTAGVAGAAAGTALSTIGEWGPALLALSDETKKEAVTPTSDDAALKAVNATPVKNWKYKKGSAGDDGGQEHTGPMAQDVQKTMGDKVAPRGKMIDLISANGINMKALQAVDKKVNKLAAAMGIEV